MPTAEEIAAARTSNGGWTKAQLAEWGIPWPPPRGWKRQLERETRGKTVPREKLVLRKALHKDMMRDLRSAQVNIDEVLAEQVGDLHSVLKTAAFQVAGVLRCLEEM